MLNKEQQQKLTEELQGFFARAEFQLDQHRITIKRVRVSESTTALAVYVDDQIRVKDMAFGEEPRAIIKKVWRKRQKGAYSPAQIKQIEKKLGKRRALRVFTRLHNKIYFYDATFNSATSLVRQFAKLDGLQVVAIGHRESNK